jgi:hypothetical protein
MENVVENEMEDLRQRVRLSAIKSIETKLDTATNPTLIASLLTDREDLLNDIAELRDSLHNIEQAEKSSRQAAAEYVYDDNENITVSEDYEIFQQTVNRIVLR